MRLTAQIGEYEMDQVVLDLGSNMNVLPKQTWEWMGRTALQWSLTQLRIGKSVEDHPHGEATRGDCRY